MPKLKIGENFPAASLQDIDGEMVKFPPIFEKAPATVVFFIAAAGDRGVGPR